MEIWQTGKWIDSVVLIRISAACTLILCANSLCFITCATSTTWLTVQSSTETVNYFLLFSRKETNESSLIAKSLVVAISITHRNEFPTDEANMIINKKQRQQQKKSFSRERKIARHFEALLLTLSLCTAVSTRLPIVVVVISNIPFPSLFIYISLALSTIHYTFFYASYRTLTTLVCRE
jgi:hypothetical protein